MYKLRLEICVPIRLGAGIFTGISSASGALRDPIVTYFDKLKATSEICPSDVQILPSRVRDEDIDWDTAEGDVLAIVTYDESIQLTPEDKTVLHFILVYWLGRVSYKMLFIPSD